MPKKIPQSRVIQHFLSLTDEKRFELLNEYWTTEKIKAEGQGHLYAYLADLRQYPDKVRAFVKEKYGDTKDHLQKTVLHGEQLATDHKNDIYRSQDEPDEEKLNKLIIDKKTMPQRLWIFYDDLYEKDKAEFDRQSLIAMKDPKKLSSALSDMRNFKSGSNKEFVDEVLKTMDLSNEKSVMEHLQEDIPQDDPERTEKLHCAAEQFMIYPDGMIDPEKLAKDLQDKNWKKKFDARDIMEAETQYSRLKESSLIERVKSTIRDYPETEEERAIFREAGLQACRDYIALMEITDKSAEDHPNHKMLLDYTRELQDEMAADAMKEQPVQDIRKELAAQYDILKQDKSGWFLSKTNSKEYDEMMKGLRIFNAKLDMLSGNEPSEALTEEERKAAENTPTDVLLANAKQGLYKYGSIKTKSGTGSIWHTAGTKRFDSSLKSLQKLGELGKKLHLSNTATAIRDETQLQVLQHRRDDQWLKENIEDAFAKSICAQVTLNSYTPEYQQRKTLGGDALEKQVEKIKSNAAFKKLMENSSPEKLADSIIKGGSNLYEAYYRASRAASREGHKRTASEIDPELIQPKKDTKGLVPGP